MKKDLHIELLEFSSSYGVPIKKLLDAFYFLNQAPNQQSPYSVLEFIENTSLARSLVDDLRKDLEYLFEPVFGHIKLSRKGEESVGLLFKNFKNYQTSNGILNFDSNILNEHINTLQDLQKSRGEAKRNFDQFYATTETVSKRAQLIDVLADIEYKNVLFLGDDDMTSVIIASYNKASKISVLDIDRDILKNNTDASQSLGYKIETIFCDARNSLPETCQGAYDIVFTDPPYTTEGFSLFLSRAIEALNTKNKAARIYICYGNSDKAKEKYIPVQEIISNHGLQIRYIFDNFNHYKGADSIGSSSSLYICDITPQTKSIIKGVYKGNIYTNI